MFAAVVGLTAVAALFAMPLLVAKPKLLFGRSLSAIAPSLFPYVTLSLLALLSTLLVVVIWQKSRLLSDQNAESIRISEDSPHADWLKVAAFFLLLAGYGLLLKPAGFLLSSFVVISAISLLLGNRNWLQILLIALLAPVVLYLLATRIMLVSLPELNRVELFYADAIAWLKGLLPL